MNYWFVVLAALAIGSIYLADAAPQKHRYFFKLNVAAAANHTATGVLAASFVEGKSNFTWNFHRYHSRIRPGRLTFYSGSVPMALNRSEKMRLLFVGSNNSTAGGTSLWIKVNSVKVQEVKTKAPRAFCVQGQTAKDLINLSHNQTVELFPCSK